MVNETVQMDCVFTSKAEVPTTTSDTAEADSERNAVAVKSKLDSVVLPVIPIQCLSAVQQNKSNLIASATVVQKSTSENKKTEVEKSSKENEKTTAWEVAKKDVPAQTKDNPAEVAQNKTSNQSVKSKSNENIVKENEKAIIMDAVNNEVLPVRCKNTAAELHKCKFGSGGRGRCIKLGDNWYTPTEFEAVSGRASSKDWKKSIKYSGKNLHSLIEDGILLPHALSCTCGACCDDENASGHARLFQPYKRKRRKQPEGVRPKKQKNDALQKSLPRSALSVGLTDGEGGLSSNNTVVLDNNTDDSGEIVCVISSAGSAPQTQPSNDSLSMRNSLEGLSTEQTWNKLEDMSNAILEAVLQLKNLIEEAKAKALQTNTRSNVENKVLQTPRLEAQVRTILNNKSEETQNEGLDLGVHFLSTKELQGCANCHEDTMFVCSYCMKVAYCSHDCQKRDWNSHWPVCSRLKTSNVSVDEASAPVMVILDSNGQITEQVLAVTSAD